MTQISCAIQQMILFYKGNIHDVDHFLKVYALAKVIGEQENVETSTQEILELAAVVHDIACPLCREKYGNTNGKKQEMESPALVESFLAKLSVSQTVIQRVSWLVAHHHTYTDVNRIDHQILLEADYLVNASESGKSKEAVRNAMGQIFKTATGKELLSSMFLQGDEAV